MSTYYDFMVEAKYNGTNYVGNGATPLGITFSNGKLITSKTYKGQGGLANWKI